MEKLLNEGFNYSGCYQHNLFYRDNNFYVMDNHGAALWAWLQQLDTNQKYNLIHIDKHYDTLDSNLNLWVDAIPSSIKKLTFEDFIGLEYNHEGMEISPIRWDNYIPIFNHFYGGCIENYIFYTHGYGNTGIKKLGENAQELSAVSLFENLDFVITESKEKAILNLDIDYFFLNTNNKYDQLYTDEILDILFKQIADCYLNTDKIEVFTVALSPECCGGWKNSIKVYNKLAEHLNLQKIEIP